MFAQYCRLNVHVFQSWRDVVRAASRKINPKSRFARNVRAGRHKWYRAMLREHLNARQLYADVMC